jgi:hypothetical protein
MDGKHFAACVNRDQCWICGKPIGCLKALVIGSMCSVNRGIWVLRMECRGATYAPVSALRSAKKQRPFDAHHLPGDCPVV